MEADCETAGSTDTDSCVKAARAGDGALYAGGLPCQSKAMVLTTDECVDVSIPVIVCGTDLQDGAEDAAKLHRDAAAESDDGETWSVRPTTTVMLTMPVWDDEAAVEHVAADAAQTAEAAAAAADDCQAASSPSCEEGVDVAVIATRGGGSVDAVECEVQEVVNGIDDGGRDSSVMNEAEGEPGKCSALAGERANVRDADSAGDAAAVDTHGAGVVTPESASERVSPEVADFYVVDETDSCEDEDGMRVTGDQCAEDGDVVEAREDEEDCEDSDGEVQVLRDDTIGRQNAVDDDLHGPDSSARCDVSVVAGEAAVVIMEEKMDNVVDDGDERAAAKVDVVEELAVTPASDTEMVVVDETSCDAVAAAEPEADDDDDMQDLEVLDSWEDDNAAEDGKKTGGGTGSTECDSSSRATEGEKKDRGASVDRSEPSGKGETARGHPRQASDVAQRKERAANVSSKLSNWRELYENAAREKSDLQVKLKQAEDASKALAEGEKEASEERARKRAALEREVAELRALAERIENGGADTNDPKPLLVQLSRKNLEIGKLNDTIEEIEESLQKVFCERNEAALKAEDLERRLSALEDRKSRSEAFATDQLATKDERICALQRSLMHAESRADAMEEELSATGSKGDTLLAEQVDLREKVAMLEINLEYAVEKGKQDGEQHCKQMRALQSDLQKTSSELDKERADNQNLRHRLKAEMDASLKELQEAMAADNVALRKEVEQHRVTEVDSLRKLEELRTKLDAVTQQNRNLIAEVKAKKMDISAYCSVAEQLKNHIIGLEKEKAGLLSVAGRGKPPAPGTVNDKDASGAGAAAAEANNCCQDSDSQEVITIDTDSDDASGPKEAAGLRASAPSPFPGHLMTKRMHSPVGIDSSSGKRQKLSTDEHRGEAPDKVSGNDVGLDAHGDLSLVASEDIHERSRSALDDVSDQKFAAESGCGDGAADAAGKIVGGASPKADQDEPRDETAAGGENAADDVRAAADCGQNAMRAELEEDLRDRTTAKEEEAAMLNSLADVARLRDELQVQLSSMAKDLDDERAKVEMLESQLLARAKSEEERLLSQQGELQRLQEDLKEAKEALAERGATIAALRDEASRLSLDKDAATEKGRLLGADLSRFEEEARERDCTLQRIADERALLAERVRVLEATEGDIRMLKQKNEMLQVDLATMTSERDRLQAAMSELTREASRIGGLERMLAELRTEVEDARTRRQALAEELVQRRREADEAQSAHEQRVADLQTRIGELNGGHERQRAELVETVESNRKTVEELRSEMSAGVRHSEELLQRCSQLERQNELLKSELVERETSVRSLRDEASCVARDLEAGHLKVKDLEREVATVGNQLAEAREHLAGALGTGRSLNQRVEELAAEVKAKHGLAVKVEALEAELAGVLEGKAMLVDRLSELRSQVTDRSACVARLREFLDQCSGLQSIKDKMRQGDDQVEEAVGGGATSSKAENIAEKLQIERLQCDCERLRIDLDHHREAKRDLQEKLACCRSENCKFAERILTLEADIKAAAVERDRAQSKFLLLKTASEAAADARQAVAAVDAVAPTRSNLCTASEKLKALRDGVQQLSDAEASLDQSMRRVGAEISERSLEDDSCRLKVAAVETGLKNARSEVPQLASEMEEFEREADRTMQICETLVRDLGLSKPQDGTAENSRSNEVISKLTADIENLTKKNEILLNRLSLSLSNGRRLEAVLQNLQKSTSTESLLLSKQQLEAIQAERIALRKKLEESDALCRMIKYKVIRYSLSCMRGEYRAASQSVNVDGQQNDIELDSWEEILKNARNYVLQQLETGGAGRVHGTVSSSSVSSESSDETRSKENDSGNGKRVLADADLGVDSKKLRITKEASSALKSLSSADLSKRTIPSVAQRKSDNCKLQ